MEDQERLNREVQERVDFVRDRISRSAERSGRLARDVQLVAVTKYATCSDGFVSALLSCGCTSFGESRPQLLLEKIEAFDRSKGLEKSSSSPILWHMIGSLQRNKIRRLLPWTALIHSIDSVRLLQAISRIAQECEEEGDTEPVERSLPEQIDVLLEVNIAQEESKHGFEAADLLTQIPELLSLPRIRLCGLMGMGALSGNERDWHRQFASLRCLLDIVRSEFPELTEFRELSMGMSHDFEIAIEEGATIVRIGSLLYPNRQ